MNTDKLLADAVREGVRDAVTKRLQDYNSVISKMVEGVIEKHSPDLQALVDSAFSEAVANPDLGPSLREAFNHKLARILVAKFEGEIEKRANELRADAGTRARITLAIERAIDAK